MVDVKADPTAATATDTTLRRDKRYLPLRVLLLAALLFALNAWTVRHLGGGLREFTAVNGFLAFVGIVLGWIDARDADSWRANFKRILERTVDIPVLAALYLVTIIGTSFISSVTVMADGRAGRPSLHLTAEGSPRCADCDAEVLEGPSDVVRYVRFTSIFGRPYYLEVSGYQRKGFTLYPWTGATISIESDLVRLPTILLRIPHSLHTSLNGGKIVLVFESSSDTFEIPMQAGHATAQLGPPAAISENLRSEWRSELRTMADVPDALRELFFRNWLNPIRNEQIPSLDPGEQVQIRFLTAAGKEVIRQNLVVGRDPLQDVILVPTD